MISSITATRLVSMMSRGDVFYFVRYMNGDYEIIAQIVKGVANSLYTRTEHFYFKGAKIYYWEFMSWTKENKRRVGDLYEINIDDDIITDVFYQMHDELKDKVGIKYSNAFMTRTDTLLGKFINQDDDYDYSYDKKDFHGLEYIDEVKSDTIPNSIKRTKIKTISSMFLDILCGEWCYNIDLKLIDIKRVR